MTETLCGLLALCYIASLFIPSLWNDSKLPKTPRHKVTIGEREPSNRCMHE